MRLLLKFLKVCPEKNPEIWFSLNYEHVEQPAQVFRAEFSKAAILFPTDIVKALTRSVITNTSFLPRDAMRSLLSPGVSVCPSFRLSVTLVHCIQAAEDIVKLFVRPSSPITLVFDSQRRYQIPSAGAQNTRGWVGKICDFRWKSPFISVTVWDRSMVAMER